MLSCFCANLGQSYCRERLKERRTPLMIEERLLTIDELAELLRINRRSVYRLIENHTIDFAIKIGGSWRFLPADFNAWLERNKPQQTTH